MAIFDGGICSMPFIQRTPNEYRHNPYIHGRYLNLQLGQGPPSFPSLSFLFLPPPSALSHPLFLPSLRSRPPCCGYWVQGTALALPAGPGRALYLISSLLPLLSSGALREMKHQTVGGLEPSSNILVQNLHKYVTTR